MADRHQVWTVDDDVLARTCELAAAAHAGRLNETPACSSPFPLSLGTDERLLVAGDFRARAWGSAGDGRYVQTIPAPGSSLTGHLIAASANSSRRRSAEWASAPAWNVIDSGRLWVGTHGFYLETGAGLFPWAFGAVTSLVVEQRGTVMFRGRTDGGQVSWLIESPWAELVFVLWAMSCYPSHPQLQNGAWLPPGWIGAAAGRFPEGVSRSEGRLFS